MHFMFSIVLNLSKEYLNFPNSTKVWPILNFENNIRKSIISYYSWLSGLQKTEIKDYQFDDLDFISLVPKVSPNINYRGYIYNFF